jgi:hypothetical protein
VLTVFVTSCRPAPAAPKAAGSALRAPAEKLPPRKPAELSNSFIITTLQDLEPQPINGKQQTPCEYAVKRARSIGEAQVPAMVVVLAAHSCSSALVIWLMS